MGIVQDRACIVELDPTTKIGRGYPAGLEEAKKTAPASQAEIPTLVSL